MGKSTPESQNGNRPPPGNPGFHSYAHLSATWHPSPILNVVDLPPKYTYRPLDSRRRIIHQCHNFMVGSSQEFVNRLQHAEEVLEWCPVGGQLGHTEILQCSGDADCACSCAAGLVRVFFGRRSIPGVRERWAHPQCGFLPLLLAGQLHRG